MSWRCCLAAACGPPSAVASVHAQPRVLLLQRLLCVRVHHAASKRGELGECGAARAAAAPLLDGAPEHRHAGVVAARTLRPSRAARAPGRRLRRARSASAQVRMARRHAEPLRHAPQCERSGTDATTHAPRCCLRSCTARRSPSAGTAACHLREAVRQRAHPPLPRPPAPRTAPRPAGWLAGARASAPRATRLPRQ